MLSESRTRFAKALQHNIILMMTNHEANKHVWTTISPASTSPVRVVGTLVCWRSEPDAGEVSSIWLGFLHSPFPSPSPLTLSPSLASYPYLPTKHCDHIIQDRACARQVLKHIAHPPALAISPASRWNAASLACWTMYSVQFVRRPLQDLLEDVEIVRARLVFLRGPPGRPSPFYSPYSPSSS
ncbi:hypothetical protein AB1N83_013717 [Pleurotus pulmonarius]